MRLKKHNILWKVIALIRAIKIRLFYNIELPSIVGQNCKIYSNNIGRITAGKRFKLFGHNEIYSEGNLVIGENLSLNTYSKIICLNEIRIGNNVNIASFVSILDHDHNYVINERKKLVPKGYITRPIHIGDNVWIGDSVQILKGVTIGSNVIIGAGSVVTGNLVQNGVYVGSPAKLIREIKL